MLQEWKDRFSLVGEVRFGPIVDKDGIKLFFDEDEKIRINVNNLKSMLESVDDFRSIMVAGHAGSGKTSLVHYVKNIIDSSRFDVFIINGEENTDQNGIIGAINHQFDIYFKSLSEKLKPKETAFDKEVNRILDALFANIVYSTRVEKLMTYLNTYNRLYEDETFRSTGRMKAVRIVLDQIDLLDSAQMMKVLYENFSSVVQTKYITAVICARFETLESAKRSVNNFFATNFNRYIEIDSVPVEMVLKKRMEACAANKSITRKYLNSIFTESFCDLMSKIQNGNIRKALSIFEHITNVMPVYSGRVATEKYTNFLLNNNYVDNLYTKINPADTIPLIKIVFDALQYQSVVNKTFFDVVRLKVAVLSTKGIGFSENNIRAAIDFLKNRSIVNDAFDIPDRYVLTPKGRTYTRLMSTPVYMQLYCKTQNDTIFSKNQFDETSFA